jgi:hypothetical protein
LAGGQVWAAQHGAPPADSGAGEHKPGVKKKCYSEADLKRKALKAAAKKKAAEEAAAEGAH